MAYGGFKYVNDAAAELGNRMKYLSTTFSLKMEITGRRGTGLPNSSRETVFSVVNVDREYCFPCSADHEQDWQDPSCRESNSRPNVSEGYEVTN